MATKITFEDKSHVLPYGTREIQVWDLDINEIKAAINDNADLLVGLEGGYQGVLLIADTPTTDGYYMAGESGTYINAGGLVVDLTNGLSYINVSDTQTTFTQTIIPIDVSLNGEVVEGETKGVIGDKIYTAIDNVAKTDLTNLLPIIEGFYFKTDGGKIANAGWNITDLQLIYPEQNYYLTLTDTTNNAYSTVVFYNAEKEILSTIVYASSIAFIKEPITIPAEAVYIAFCAKVAGFANIEFHVDTDSATSVLHKPIEEVEQLIDITDSIILIQDEYFSRDEGIITEWDAFYRTNYIEISPTGRYFFSCGQWFQNANIYSFFDSEYRYISGKAQEIGYEPNKELLVVPSNAKYIGFSVKKTTLAPLFFYSTEFTALAKPNFHYSETKFAMSKYTDAVLNMQTNIFLDNVGLQDNFNVDLSDTSIELLRVNRCLRYEPTSVSTDKDLILKNRDTQGFKNCLVRTVPQIVGNGTVEKNIMILGDSLTIPDSFTGTVFNQLNTDNDFIINQVGVNGSIYKHEGRSSWKWSDYVNEESAFGSTNPFLYSGVLDFSQYITDNGFSGLDIVMINLGTNDVTQGSKIATEQTIAPIIVEAKIFIDAIIADYPNCKISIGLQAVGAPQFTYKSGSDIFRDAIGQLNQAYVDNFDNGIYNANVTTHNRHVTIEREYSYQYTEEAISARSPQLWKKYINNVHPLDVGYEQFADADYAKIRAFLNGDL